MNKIFENKISPFFKAEILDKKELLQLAKIKVNEKGTEAAAVTYMLAGIDGVPPEPKIKFIANRPFFFLIRELNSNSLLFTGILTEPPKFVRAIDEETEKNSWLRNILDFFKFPLLMIFILVFYQKPVNTLNLHCKLM